MTTLPLALRAVAVQATAGRSALPVAWAVGAILAVVMVAPSALGGVLLVDWTDSVERAVIGGLEALGVLWWAASPSAAVPALRRGDGALLALIGATMLLAAASAPHMAPAVVRVAEWTLHAAFVLIVWAEAGRRDSRVTDAWRRGSLTGFAVVLGTALGLWMSMDSPEAHAWTTQFPFLHGVRWLGTYGLVAIFLPVAIRTATPRTALTWQTAGWLAIWWSGSRGALCAAALAALVLVALSTERQRTGARLAAAALLGAVLSVPLSMPQHQMGLARLWTSTVGGNGGNFTSGRSALWHTTLDAWLARPWTGTGPDGVLPLLSPLGSPHAHNTVLQALAEGGWIGGVPFLAAFAWMLVAAVRRAWQTRDPVRVGATAYLVAMMANGLLDGILYDPGSTLLVAAAFGVALAPQQADGHASRIATPAVLRMVALVGLAVMLLHAAVLRAVWAPGTPAPDSWRPALVRAFPSAPVLSPLAGWGRAWQADQPGAALNLARWGARQGRSPWVFDRLAADVLAPADPTAARAALDRAHRMQAHATRYVAR